MTAQGFDMRYLIWAERSEQICVPKLHSWTCKQLFVVAEPTGDTHTLAALQACLEATGGPQTWAHTQTGAALLYHQSCSSGISAQLYTSWMSPRRHQDLWEIWDGKCLDQHSIESAQRRPTHRNSPARRQVKPCEAPRGGILNQTKHSQVPQRRSVSICPTCNWWNLTASSGQTWLQLSSNTKLHTSQRCCGQRSTCRPSRSDSTPYSSLNLELREDVAVRSHLLLLWSSLLPLHPCVCHLWLTGLIHLCRWEVSVVTTGCKRIHAHLFKTGAQGTFTVSRKSDQLVFTRKEHKSSLNRAEGVKMCRQKGRRLRGPEDLGEDRKTRCGPHVLYWRSSREYLVLKWCNMSASTYVCKLSSAQLLVNTLI